MPPTPGGLGEIGVANVQGLDAIERRFLLSLTPGCHLSMEFMTLPIHLAITLVLSSLGNDSTVVLSVRCRVCRLVVGSREMVSRHHIVPL